MLIRIEYVVSVFLPQKIALTFLCIEFNVVTCLIVIPKEIFFLEIDLLLWVLIEKIFCSDPPLVFCSVKLGRLIYLFKKVLIGINRKPVKRIVQK